MTGKVRVALSNFALVPTPAYTVALVNTTDWERGMLGINRRLVESGADPN